MKYLHLLIALLVINHCYSQIVIDDFESGTIDSWIESATDLSVENQTLKVECDNVGGKNKYDLFFVNIPSLDMSKFTKIKLRLKVEEANLFAPRLRFEVRDINGFDSNLLPIYITPELNNDFVEYELNFKGRLRQQSPSYWLDASNIVRLQIYINADYSSSFSGTFYMDDLILEGAQSPNIIDYEEVLKFASDSSLGWKSTLFDDALWTTKTAPVLYNIEGETSNLTAEEYTGSAFFRKVFSISDTSGFKSILLSIKSDDEAKVYLNDSLVVDYPHSAISERFYVLPLAVLDSGENVLAIHQTQNNDVVGDLKLDIKLEGIRYEDDLIRGPYLQMNREDAIRLKWRTLSLSNSVVKYGLSPSNLDDSVLVASEVLDHVVDLSGLLPFTKYYYSIGKEGSVLAGSDSSHYFVTHPSKGTNDKYEFWVVGDAGRSTNDQRNMMKSYVEYKGNKETHSWLLLGDNAYDHGTEDEYQRAMFENMFEDMLINTNIYPTPGNHDLDKHGSPMGGITEAPYFDIFDVPANGETGGVASGTESYYSWDYGNVHFISLDSYGTSLDENDEMYNWLKSDLQANNQRWTVAYCHHPPHSKGSHDSDDAQDSYGALFKIREIMMPLLEDYGVDLVLTGHSHVYERSYLSHGFYKQSSYLPERDAILYPQSAGDIEVPYKKNVVHSEMPNKGTVYAVVGCSGSYSDKAEWDNEPNNYMTNDFFHVSEKDYTGSFILNIDSDTLRGSFLTNKGVIMDDFRIVKDSISDMRYVYGVGSVIRGGEPTFDWADSTAKDTLIVRWETKFLAETKFDYGMHIDSLSSIYDPTLKLFHEVKIAVETEGQTYYAVGYNEYKYMLPVDDQRYVSHAIIGLDADVPEVSFDVYPNPVTELLSVQLDLKYSQKVSISLVDMKGVVRQELLTEVKLSTGQINEQFSVNVPAGMYTLRVDLGNQSIGKQVLID